MPRLPKLPISCTFPARNLRLGLCLRRRRKARRHKEGPPSALGSKGGPVLGRPDNGPRVYLWLKTSKMLSTVGPSNTMNSVGRIVKISGKSILTGIFMACSSARWRRLTRMSLA